MEAPKYGKEVSLSEARKYCGNLQTPEGYPNRGNLKGPRYRDRSCQEQYYLS